MIRYLLSMMVICVWFKSVSFAQSDNRIIILGTVHNGNKQVTSKTLTAEIEKIKPDIILWESSDSFRVKPGLGIAIFLGVVKVGVEQPALQKYIRRNPSVKVLPYDTSFVSRRDYINRVNQRRTNFYRSIQSLELSSSDKLLTEEYIKMKTDYLNSSLVNTIEQLNQPDFYKLAGKIYQMEIDSILPICRKYNSNSAEIDSFEAELIFWRLRNNYMVERILEHFQNNRGKRILVLTGLNHKYFLMDRLPVY